MIGPAIGILAIAGVYGLYRLLTTRTDLNDANVSRERIDNFTVVEE
jgi:hypothetical protein